MKKSTLIAALLLVATISFGQCDQDVTLTASKTTYLNGSGAVEREEDEQSIIEINKSQITITPGNADHKMVGKIESTTCNWTSAYQEGNTVIKAVFDGPSGAQMHATMTTEGKAGKITFLMEIVEMPDKKIFVNIDSFQESKKN
ncbi:hypothetical protein [Dyadobacter pollutisoli]|jgi:hypothetical protein|uniref:Lipocalin-like domain-containing protein n=1 Tax=Dyadobacter pollutisoli TaxID=2910158 RepID=A0A9E8NG89_9BACT|nr:hypothetical protein [Dyadobacter pollutisoli]WAC14743.1 hypothetical protein ON006_12430 [Dyadobacter pollutisoli]